MAKAHDDELRRRVQRILRGDIRTEDITALCLGLRFRSHGRSAFREIGDFIAHPDAREKGLLTETARDFFTAVRFMVDNNGYKKFPHYNIVGDIAAYFEAQLRRQGPEIVKNQTGIGYKRAKRIMHQALKSFQKAHDGTSFLAAPLTQEQSMVLNCCENATLLKPAFTYSQLTEEFSEVIEKNNLLVKSERDSFHKVDIWLTLLAVASMHRTEISLADGWRAELSAYSGDGRVAVAVSAQVPLRESGEITIVAPLFSTDLNVVHWYDKELLKPSGLVRPIEVGPGPKLIPL